MDAARPFPTFDHAKEVEREKTGISLADFFAYMPMHNYIHAPSRQTWPGASVNARLPPVVLTDANGQPLLTTRASRKPCRPPRGSTSTNRSNR
jgi:hypothetical protein